MNMVETLPLPPKRVPASVSRTQPRLSPPSLPPRWGQDVAPPPTPFFSTPHASPPQPPEEAEDEGQAPSVRLRPPQRRRHHKCHHRHHHQRSSRSTSRSSLASSARHHLNFLPEDEVITYAYRFTGHNLSQIHKDEIGASYPMVDLAYRTRHLRQQPPYPAYFDRGDDGWHPNSQSASPVFTTAGSSPDTGQPHPVSPASPASDEPPPIPPRRSALRTEVGGAAPVRKTVQWLSDWKRRPEEISTDRRVVKRQYNTDNESERRRLEQRVEQLRQEERVGAQHRQDHLATLNRVQSEIKLMSADMAGHPSHHPRSANLEQLYQDNLPSMNHALSNSGPPAFHGSPVYPQEDTASVLSWTSSIRSVQTDTMSMRRRRDIDTKIECVDSMITLLDCKDVEKMSRVLEAMSSTPANCNVIREKGFLQGIVNILHQETSVSSAAKHREIRIRLSRALNNVVNSELAGRNSRKREAKVLKLLETLRMFCDVLRDLRLAISSAVESRAASVNNLQMLANRGCGQMFLQLRDHMEPGEYRIYFDTLDSNEPHSPDDRFKVILRRGNCVTAKVKSVNFINFSQEDFELDGSVIVPLNISGTLAMLTKFSFDEAHRKPIAVLGGINVLAELAKVERELHQDISAKCAEVKRYAIVALTNLTFGNEKVKSFLCNFDAFIPVMVKQLDSPFPFLLRATAQLFRNLAWKAERSSKQRLSDSGVVLVLLRIGMAMQRSQVDSERDDVNLKVILSALWNLSAHCGKNKADICSMDGALEFLVNLLHHTSVDIVENGGGILRNIASYIATSENSEHFRATLRRKNCLSLLLELLESPKISIVSNACGTLWNLSARCSQDQEALRTLNAIPRLMSLTNSKHDQIAKCAKATLKNLCGSSRPLHSSQTGLKSSTSSNGMPQLEARRRRNMMLDLDHHHHLDEHEPVNFENSDSDSDHENSLRHPHSSSSVTADRSESQNSLSSIPSVTSNHSDFRHRLGNASSSLERNPVLHEEPEDQPERQPMELSKSRRQQVFPTDSGSSSFGGFNSSNTFGPTQYNNFVTDERVMSASNLFPSANVDDDDHEGDEEPTDFSARFGDNDEEDNDDRGDDDLDDSPKTNAKDNTETVKTYNTEGTPYMLSNSTSLSDLRELPQDGAVGGGSRLFYPRPPLRTNTDHFTDNLPSGMDTPAMSEKLKEYCDEGTPADCFSRTDSLSPLDFEGPHQQHLNIEQLEDVDEQDDDDDAENGQDITEKGAIETRESKDPSPLGHRANTPPVLQPAHKSVSFNPHETPLMFSRASSPESLSSEKMQSIRTGYSSCDFSRTTTRPVSPSDLPDSPCQTRPHSPKRHASDSQRPKEQLPSRESNSKSAFPFARPEVPTTTVASTTAATETAVTSAAAIGGPPSSNGHSTKISDEEEQVKVFAAEDTPQVFSSTTSFSKLGFSSEEEEDLSEARDAEQPANVDEMLSAPASVSVASSTSGRVYEDDEEIYDELTISKIVQSGMPTKKKDSRPNSRSDGRRSHNSGIPVRSGRSSAASTTSSRPPLAPATVPKPTVTPRKLNFDDKPNTDSNEGDSDDDLDMLNEVTKMGMPTSQRHLPGLGVRGHGEGALTFSSRSNRQSKSEPKKSPPKRFEAWKSSDHDERSKPPQASLSRPVLPTSTVSKESDSSTRLFTARHQLPSGLSSGLTSGHETPRKFACEDTPAALSSNASLSSFSEDEIADLPSCPPEGVKFRSHIPRPDVVGRSESSESSTQGKSSSQSGSITLAANGSHNACSSSDSDDEELLQRCVASGMPKSKSVPVNLRNPDVKRRSPPKREKRRSLSKSPRSSKLIPGVRIQELKLKPKESKAASSPDPPTTAETQMVERPEVADENKPDFVEAKQANLSDQPPARSNSLEETLTASRVIELEANKVSSQVQQQANFLLSSTCSNLSSIQPPSIMDSLISMTDKSGPSSLTGSTVQPPSQFSPKKLDRNTLSGKKGHAMPEMVRRALGINGSPSHGAYNDDLSSISSCVSNLDNIQPPSLMDSSMLSITSFTSEVADNPSTEQIDKLIKPSADKAAELALATASEGENLDSIEPPTLMDEVSGVLSSMTLVADQNGGGTYVIESANQDESTCQDITDVFDEDTLIDPNLTVDSDNLDADEAPELPRDSRNGTPGQSRDGSPKKKAMPRPNFDHFKQFRVPTPELDDSAEDRNMTEEASKATSGYKSFDLSSPRSSRMRRKEDVDRFKTRTITKGDLSSSSLEGSPRFSRRANQSFSGSESGSDVKRSPKSIKQRREEESERFKTQTITSSDLRVQHIPLGAMETKEETQAVRDGNSGSSSPHVEPSDVAISGTTDNLVSPKRGPRICKPGEESPTKSPQHDTDPLQSPGIRGRRKPLYSSPPSRSTVPPAVAPKPSLGPKPKIPTRYSSPPPQIRGTRASTLRQTTNQNRTSPPASPKNSPKHVTRNTSSPSPSASSASSRQSTASRTSSSKLPSRVPTATNRPLVRQGTFTKDDSSSNMSGEESASLSKMPPKVPQKPGIRRDVVHPVSNSRSVDAGSRGRNLKIPQTRTSQLRERSSSRAREASSGSLSLQKNYSSGSNSSLASSKSSRSHHKPPSMIRPSASNQSLKSESRVGQGLEKKAKSTAGMEPQDPDSAKKKSEVTSKIANLWKKVEDSKKKNKDKDVNKKWITQGKVIPESELALLQVHQEQKEIIKNFQAKKAAEVSNSSATSTDTSITPTRSRSRLSMKLSKITGNKKDSKEAPSKSPIITPTTETPLANEDSANANVSEDNGAKRLSRLGSFFNPEEESQTPALPPKSPTSAIVPPFNYNPPKSNGRSHADLVFAKPRPPALKTSQSSTQVRRNDSYVSSMGRRPRDDESDSDHGARKPPTAPKGVKPSSSSSMLVTLV